MSYEYLNLHPQGKRVGDCAKRSLTLLTGLPYKEVSLTLNRLKKKTGCAYFNDMPNIENYINNLGWRKMSFPAVKGCSRMTGEKFCEYYPKGKYLLRMARHLTAVVDGVIYDTWNCSEKCVYNAWEVK